jgi:crotonobetainyl-CoA:carnitine CoA-transferase CaiB-like acyl-CoA transferase
VARLRGLLQAADVVIEGSRPRALRQWGVDAKALLADGDGPRVWVSITGYGREGPAGERVAFGDDAAAAGGLLGRDAAGPCFLADAVADPLTGIAAASAVTTALAEGGSWLLDAALAKVAASVADPQPTSRSVTGPVVRPRARLVPGPARPLGADTAAVLAELP